jgi:ankyrin repeat protein
MSAETRFSNAVEAGDAAAIRGLFTSDPALKRIIDEPWFAFDSPAIVHAAGQKNRALIDALLDCGADIDARSAWGAGPYSALHRLVDGISPESTELAEHLLSRGATLDLHTAAGLGRLDVVASILDGSTGRVNEPGPDGATPLHLARNAEMAALLVSRGAEIDKRCVDHRSTPAQWSVGDRPDVARFLLDRGARTDLFMAAVLDDVDMAARLLEADPSAIEVRVSGGKSNEHLGFGDKYTWSLNFAETPIEIARRRGNDAVYAFLLGRSPPAVQLLQAARRNDLLAIHDIVDGNPGLLDTLDADTACGVLCGGAGSARLLVELGVDPNARDTAHGATPLHHASWRNDRELIDVLLDAGADLHIRDSLYDGTPLGWAAHAGHEPLVEVLTARMSLT